MNKKDYYSILGVTKGATKNELKKAYRSLVKKHHPDAGGNKETFLMLQLAWETLNDPIKKGKYDKTIYFSQQSCINENNNWSNDLKDKKQSSNIKDYHLQSWLKNIYTPIYKTISEIAKPLNNEITKLSADPYDDELMEGFCEYIAKSQKKIERVSLKYKSQAVPATISSLGLDLYHCFSQVQDSLNELERYTQGYVDDYLFDGKEMMQEAKRIQKKMMNHKKNISF